MSKFNNLTVSNVAVPVHEQTTGQFTVQSSKIEDVIKGTPLADATLLTVTVNASDRPIEIVTEGITVSTSTSTTIIVGTNSSTVVNIKKYLADPEPSVNLVAGWL